MNQPPKAKVFVEGRYRKLTRDLPQTVFFCPECKGHPRRRKACARCEGFGKLCRDSVQELIGWAAQRHFGTRKNKFHGAGREDVDVRMLGEGRPFVMELLGPKQFDVDLVALETEVNRRNEGRLEVLGLHWTEATRVRVVKETQHAKEYEALVSSEGVITPEAIAALIGPRRTIAQQTPERVAHRRAMLERERWVEFLGVEPAPDAELEARERGFVGEVDGHLWRVRLVTQHGTYVKEVLSGQGAITKPSFPDLVGTPCRCLTLDVTAILGPQGEAEPVPARPVGFGAGLG